MIVEPVAKTAENKMPLRALSLLLAVLIFLFVFSETEGELTVSVPVEYVNLPAGLIAESPRPAAISMAICGPRILLAKTKLAGITLRLDLQGAHPGLNRFPDPERFVGLDRQVRARSALPVLDVTLESK